MSLPSNIPSALSELLALSSDILYLAGDRSVDASWYTKRLSVAAIYASAEIVMTEDTSPGFKSTMEFLERRIKDSQTIAETTGDVTRFLGSVAGGLVGIARSWGMKV